MIGWPMVLGVAAAIGCVVNGLRDTGLADGPAALRAGGWGALASGSIVAGIAVQVALS